MSILVLVLVPVLVDLYFSPFYDNETDAVLAFMAELERMLQYQPDAVIMSDPGLIGLALTWKFICPPRLTAPTGPPQPSGGTRASPASFCRHLCGSCNY